MTDEQDTNTVEAQVEKNTSLKGDKFLWLVLILIIGVFSWVGWKQHAILNTLLISYETYNDNASRLAKWPEHLSAIETQVQAQQSTIEDLQKQIKNLRRKVASVNTRLTTPTKQTLLLSDAHSLMRLAEQKLWLTQDISNAQALLKKADSFLVELNDPRYRPIRAALAADLQQLNQTPVLDREGLVLQLKAIAQAVTDARLHRSSQSMPMQKPTAQSAYKTTDANWQNNMYAHWEQFKTQFIRIRHQDELSEPLFSESSAQQVKDTVNSLLLQAQVAVGAGNQKTYESSLNEASHLFARYITQQAPQFKATQQQLTQLATLPVTQTQIPELSAVHLMHQALQDALTHHQKQQG